MPIYKITVPERVVSTRTRTHLTSPPSPTWNDSSSDLGSTSGTLAFHELTEADRERERTMTRKQEVTSHADHGQVKTEQQPIKESIITKEIRLQMEREAELEALHKALLHLTTTHAKESALNHGNRHGDAHHHGDVHHHGDPHHHGDARHDGKFLHHGNGRQHGGVGQQHHAGIGYHGDNKTIEGRGRDHVTPAYDPIGQHHWSTGSGGHGVKVTAHHGVEPKGHGVKAGSDFSRRHATAAASSAKRPPEDTRIVKELMEQRRREEELREHWKEIGMEVEKRDFDTTDSVFLLTDYTAPPSPPHDNHHHHHGNGVAVTMETRVLGDGNPPPPQQQQQQQQQQHGSTNGTGQSSVSPPQDARRPSTPRVQPFEEFEKLHLENDVPYTPHRESLMEREIRSVLMREDALRLTRGLGPLMIDDGQGRVEVAKPRPRSESVEEQLDLATSMKKFAENRLRKELQTEKQREIDLLQLGKIRSLSEHRTGGEQLKYAEVSTTPDIIDELGPPKMRRETSRDHGVRFSAEMEYSDPHHHRHQYHGEGEVRGHAVPSAKYPSHSVSRPSSQVYYASHGEDKGQGQGQGQGQGHYSTRSAAEKRIELEVLEARRREQELKELRKSMLDLTVDKGHHGDGHATGSSSGATGHAHDVIIIRESGGRTPDHSHEDTSSARNGNSHGMSLSFNSD